MKAPLYPIQAYTPLELVHVVFTSKETTMELNQPSSIKNGLVLTDHFTRYVMAFITKDQKAKTVAHILYERFISVFGTPVKLLSDHGMNFMSTLVEKLCSAFGIQKCRTTTYHMQCNGQVERFHQTLFRMIGKLATDPICCHGVLTPLPHICEVTLPPHRLFLPNDWCRYKSPLCSCLCGRGAEVLQRGLC